MTIPFSPIGIIQSPYHDIKGMPIQSARAKDVHGKVLVDEDFPLYQLPVGSSGKADTRTHDAQLQLSRHTIEPGTYDVFVSIGSRIGTPQIALPLGDGDEERRYRIGVVVGGSRDV